MKEIIVNKKYDGKKLNTFLLDNFDGLSLNLLYKTLRKKDVRVNQVKVSENIAVHEGDVVCIYLTDEQLFKLCSDIKIDIIYEDDNIIVINKPAGIEVTGNNSLTTQLNKFLSARDNKVDKQDVKPCHRLDRNTTGLTLFAKNEDTLNILLDAFKNHEIEKHYYATVFGIPKAKQETLTAYLFKDRKKSMVYVIDTPKKGYEKIVTSYKVVSCDLKKDTSILDVTLHTGKTHQIRAHLAHIGFPIVGDRKVWKWDIK